MTRSKDSLEVYRALAQLHFKYLNKGFLSSLGIPFLTLLYEAIDANKESILIVEKVNGKVIGFVSGTNGLGPIYKQLLFRLHRLATRVDRSYISQREFQRLATKIERLHVLHRSGRLIHPWFINVE